MFDKFTSTELILIIGAICSGIGGLIAAAGALVLQIINAKKMDTTIEKVEEANATAVETGAKVDVVAGHVNSARTEAKVTIDALQAQIGGMTLEMAKREQIAALLAQTKISNGIAAKASHDAPIPVIVENPPSDPVPTTKGAPPK